MTPSSHQQPAQRRPSYEERRQRLIHEGQVYRADMIYMKQVVRAKLLGAPAPNRSEAKDPAGSGHLRTQAMSMIGQYANLNNIKRIQALIPVVTGVVSLLTSKRKTTKPLAKLTILGTAALGILRFLQRKRLETGARMEPTPMPHHPAEGSRIMR